MDEKRLMGELDPTGTGPDIEGLRALRDELEEECLNEIQEQIGLTQVELSVAKENHNYGVVEILEEKLVIQKKILDAENFLATLRATR